MLRRARPFEKAVALRVLQIIHSPDPGGVLALSKDIAAGLERAGYRVDTSFVAPRAGMSRLAKLRGLVRIAWRVAFGGYRTVIAYQAAPSIMLGLLGLVVWRPQRIVHQTTIPPATSASARWLDRIIGTVGLYPVNIVNTVATRDEFAGYPAAYRRRLRLIEHGVPKPLVTQDRATTLARHGIPNGSKVLLNTGRLVEDKGQATIIRALPDLPDARFVVAGEGEARADYEQLARELGVADRVHLLGALPHEQAVQLYGAADLFVFPTRNETFGISAVEAVLLGLPTVVSDLPVLNEVLNVDGTSHVAFVPAHDVAAWTAALSAWLEQPPSEVELKEFGARLGRKYAPERMLNGYLDLVRSGGSVTLSQAAGVVPSPEVGP